MQDVRETGGPAAYPPPPWHLAGMSVQALRLVPIDLARDLVPRDVRIAPVLPRRTLGVLYCARYEASPVMSYHELALAPALIYCRGRIGFWISHIYVDELASLAGGRLIWGLPKNLATFRWHPGAVSVSQGEQLLCSFSWIPRAASLRLPTYVPVISRAKSRLQYFSASGTATLGHARAIIETHPASVFRTLGFERTRTILFAQRLALKISAPR